MSTVTINQSVGTREFDDFFFPGYEILTDRFTVASGQDLEEHEVVAKNSVGKIVTWDESASSPENVAIGITVRAVDATAADTVADLYVKGVFNADKVVYSGTGGSEDDANDSLRQYGIYLKRPVSG